MRFSTLSTALFGLASVVNGMGGVSPDSKFFRVKSPSSSNKLSATSFTSQATDDRVKYVKNSGVCETTEGVNQYSGYISVGKNMSMWFWFFEARNNPSTAPVALWLNGGPGCSSLIGLFQENGPCHFVNNQTEPSLNPNSWNEYANMLYIDQPIGSGFSFGDYKVNSTPEAAPYVWDFLQVFFEEFSQFSDRDFGIFTESYGGHYAPQIASYILEQNAAIEEGSAIGNKINLVSLGINNGWMDPGTQYLAYATYANKNPYKQVLNDQTIGRFIDAYEKYCVPALNNCTEAEGQNDACANADKKCNTQMYTNLMIASKVDFNVYDLRLKESDEVPPESFIDYITQQDIMDKIGATTRFAECDDTVYYNFASTGDEARNIGPVLSEVIQQNITTVIWAGDADWICNWDGVLNATHRLEWDGQEELQGLSLQNYTVNGTVHGQLKVVDNLSVLNIYGAGHEVPYYEPEAALQVFIQTMQRKPLTST